MLGAADDWRGVHLGCSVVWGDALLWMPSNELGDAACRGAGFMSSGGASE